MGAKIAVSTCLWFQKDAEEAAELYVSLFDDAKITSKMMQGDTALTVIPSAATSIARVRCFRKVRC